MPNLLILVQPTYERRRRRRRRGRRGGGESERGRARNYSVQLPTIRRGGGSERGRARHYSARLPAIPVRISTRQSRPITKKRLAEEIEGNSGGGNSRGDGNSRGGNSGGGNSGGSNSGDNSSDSYSEFEVDDEDENSIELTIPSRLYQRIGNLRFRPLRRA